jgi:hypothetical protein
VIARSRATRRQREIDEQGEVFAPAHFARRFTSGEKRGRRTEALQLERSRGHSFL